MIWVQIVAKPAPKPRTMLRFAAKSPRLAINREAR
jgi:hypothetical protein